MLLAGLAFAVAVQVSVAGEFRDRVPQLALKFAPADAEARARLAGALAANNPLPEARQAARELARDAIRRDPLAPIAFRALALARATEGRTVADQEEAADLFRQAERLSRRDHVTQLWLAEYHLRRNQLPLVLRHFDIALRTTSSQRDALFPLLATAAADRKVADALIVRMREKPHWATPFANYMLGGQAPPAAAAYIFQGTLDADEPEDRLMIEAMMQRLAATGEYRLAGQLYNKFDLGSAQGANLVNDAGFNSFKGVRPFAWFFVEEANLWAAPERRPEGGNALVLSASGGRSGVLGRQLLQLPKGTYRIAAKLGNVPREAYNRPTVSVRCAESDAVLAVLRPARPGSPAQAIDGRFSVPDSCSFQWILISMAGAERQAMELPWIDDVTISRFPG